MKEIMEYLKVRYCSEKGQGIMEYALILAFVVVVAAGIASGTPFTNAVKKVFTDMAGLFGVK